MAIEFCFLDFIWKLVSLDFGTVPPGVAFIFFNNGKNRAQQILQE